MAPKRRTLRLPKLYRSVELTPVKVDRAEGGDDQPNQYDIAISSEYPVERWFGTEVLVHTKQAVDMSRMRNGAAVLVDHFGDQVGVVTDAHVDDDKVLRGRVQFSRNPRGQEVERDIVDGIRRHISVGYIPQRVKLAESADDGDVFHVTRWLPLEVSVVSVPADPTVGVGRALEGAAEQFAVEIETDADGVTEERTNMEPTKETPPVAPSPSLVPDTRATDIATLGHKYGMGERVAGWIGTGQTVDQVRAAILAELETRGTITPARELALDVPKRDRKAYSYARAIEMACRMQRGEAGSGLEYEVHQEIAKRIPSGYAPRGGLFIPNSLDDGRLSKRAGLDSATATAGAELVFDVPGELIELLRNYAAVINLGATVLPGLTNPVTFPKQTAGMTFYWVAENSGADVTQSDLTTGTVLLTPKTVMGRTAYSRQLLQIGNIAVENMVRTELARGNGLAIDYAAIHGLGSSNEPTGIYAASGTNSYAMGGAPTFAKMVDMTGLVAEDNADFGSLGWLTHPLKAAGLMQTLVASAAGSTMIWTGTYRDGMATGYKAAASSQVSKAMTGSARTGGSSYGLIFGNWADLLIGLFGAQEIIVDPYTLAGQGMVRVISFQMTDLAIRHGESFCKGTGVS